MMIAYAVFAVPLFSQEGNPAAGWKIDQNDQEFTAVRAAYMRAQRHTRAGDSARQQSEALLKEAMALLSAGKTGEARRRFHHGMTLLRGRQWTAREEHSSSLVLRTGFTVFDSDRPFWAHLGQIYPSQHSFSTGPRVRLSLHAAETPSPGSIRLGAMVRDLGTRGGVASDLIEEPFLLEADLSGLPDGAYGLVCELRDGDEPFCTLVKSVYAVRGLATIQAEVEGRLRGIKGHESLKATIRYPFDFARRMNAGSREQRHENIPLLAARSRVLTQDLAQGKDPLHGAKGDLTRHHYLKEADAILPYRLFVPAAYDGKRELPLVVALHGSGGSENTMMDRDKALLKVLAERYSYIVASPPGYRPNSGYGRGQSPEQSVIPGLMKTAGLAERDVMHVVELVRKEYRVDSRRIYLLGHSGGGGGTWTLGVQYPGIWAARAPIASAFVSSAELDLTRVKDVPVLVSHGNKDTVAPIESSLKMVEKLKQAGGHLRFPEVPGADHDTVVAAVLPQAFEFFKDHARLATAQEDE